MAYLILEPGATVSFIGDVNLLPRNKPGVVLSYALAAQYMGFNLVYLEAGSGAEKAVPIEMVKTVSENIDIPVVVGGGIAGSIAARFIAEKGFKTLLLEKKKTPRNKPCSGIQFSYFEKLIGEKIPQEKLCSNPLSKVEITTPKDKLLKGKMKMLNFWRKPMVELL